MKTYLGWMLGLLVVMEASMSTTGAQTNTQMERIYGSESSNEKTMEYLVPRALLFAQTNEWLPGAQRLPAKLRDLSEKARRHLEATGRTNQPLKVCAMSINTLATRWLEGERQQV